MDLQVVPYVDFERYSGKWYEIARLPNRFERSCSSNTTAMYTPLSDGRIMVVNQCRTADGKVKSVRGSARVANAKGPKTKLKVTFFWPFSGDYWIIDLDPEYLWAVVGEPSRKYFWILSREPELDPAIYSRLVARAEDEGYDLRTLVKTPQLPGDAQAADDRPR